LKPKCFFQHVSIPDRLFSESYDLLDRIQNLEERLGKYEFSLPRVSSMYNAPLQGMQYLAAGRTAGIVAFKPA
jgi:hypothetical protein